jgi:hypothetical protein
MNKKLISGIIIVIVFLIIIFLGINQKTNKEVNINSIQKPKVNSPEPITKNKTPSTQINSEDEKLLSSYTKLFEKNNQFFIEYMRYYSEDDLKELREHAYKDFFLDYAKLRKKYNLDEKECDNGGILCEGICFPQCDDYFHVPKCTDSGLICEFDPDNCPPNRFSCGNKCYQDCHFGFFECIDGRGSCYIYYQE